MSPRTQADLGGRHPTFRLPTTAAVGLCLGLALASAPPLEACASPRNSGSRELLGVAELVALLGLSAGVFSRRGRDAGLDREAEARTAGREAVQERLAAEATERRRIEENLRISEAMVAERSAELFEANRLLSQEIEARRNTEVALRQSEERWRSVVEGLSEGIALLSADERRRNEERLRFTLDLNHRAPELSEQEIFALALDEAVSLTSSRIGYLHRVGEDQQSIELVTWNREALDGCQAPFDREYPLDQAGVWADSARTRRPVLHNDYASVAEKKGYPEGHVPVVRHLSVPALDRNKVRLILGVGNKSEDYTEADVARLELLATDLLRVIMRRRAEEALRASEGDLEKLVERLEQSNRILSGVTRSQGLLIDDAPPEQVLERLLETVLLATKSEHGFLSEVGFHEQGLLFVRSDARAGGARGSSLDARQGWSRMLSCPAFLAGEVVICSDVPRDQLLGSLPSGHPPLRSCLGVPLKRGQELVGYLGVANRPQGYGPELLHEIEALVNTAATLLDAVRSTRLRRIAEGERESALQRALATEAELRLRDGAVEAAANAIVLTDREGRILWANSAFTELTGWEREEVVGRRPAILSSGAHEPQFYRQLWETILRGEVWRGELTNRRKDGSTYREEMTITPLRGAGGEISHFVAVKQSLVWRDEADRRLRESEQRYRSLVEGVEAIVWEWNLAARRLSFVSHRVETLLGYSPEELTSDPERLAQVIHSQDRRRFESEVCEMLRGERRSEFEWRAIARSGQVLWLRTVVSHEPEGLDPTRLTGFSFDVTRARELELAVRRAADEWIGTFDAMEYAVLVVDEENRVGRLNRAALGLLGRTWSEVVGRGLAELEIGRPSTVVTDLVEQVRSGRQSRRDRVCDERGRTWEIEATGVPGPVSGPGRIIVSFRDVSQIVRLQESVRRTETMAAMGALVSGVAHEVRNPLFAMSVNIDALALELREQPEVKELIDALRVERDRINRLMEELLDYGRPTAPQLAIYGIQTVLARAVASCAPTAAQFHVEIDYEAPSEALIAMIDATRVQEVFQNVLENACQHSPPGSRVRVGIVRVEDLEGSWAQVDVQDAGAGFPAEVLPRVFEPFFTRRKGGTGLGLAIVRRFVDEHRGRVVAFNGPEGNGWIRVWLPLAELETFTP